MVSTREFNIQPSPGRASPGTFRHQRCRRRRSAVGRRRARPPRPARPPAPARPSAARSRAPPFATGVVTVYYTGSLVPAKISAPEGSVPGKSADRARDGDPLQIPKRRFYGPGRVNPDSVPIAVVRARVLISLKTTDGANSRVLYGPPGLKTGGFRASSARILVRFLSPPKARSESFPGVVTTDLDYRRFVVQDVPPHVVVDSVCVSVLLPFTPVS